MKLAITVKTASPDTQVETRFGRTPYFAICDLDGENEVEFIENLATLEAHGAGVMAAQTLIDHGVDTIVCAKYGPNGSRALQQAGIQCYVFANENTLTDVLEAYKNGTLVQFSE